MRKNNISTTLIDESGYNSLGGNARESREDKIRQKAFEIAQQRGFVPGHELDDWLEAEHEINQETNSEGRAL